MIEFKKLVKENEGYWAERPNVTCEFSTSGDNLAEKMLYLNERSDYIERGIWQLSHCETCKGYNPDTPYHVEIRAYYNHYDVSKLNSANYRLECESRKYHREDSVMVPVKVLEELVDWMGNGVDRPEQYDEWLVATQILDDHKDKK